MTTIPIEVIIQDAESPVDPTPTPVDPADQGENTNIIVPDTGAGIVDSNSGVSGPSAAISIVSIVIAILAIGAVIALLVRKSYKRKVDKSGMTRQEKRAMAATSTIAVLALTALLGQLVVAGVVNPLATNAATSEEAELDVDDKITIVATRTEDEEVAIATVRNTSIATSHQTFGYKVTASMATDATTANLYLDGDETSKYFIAPVEDGTLSDNTWGYTLEEESEDYLSIPLAADPAVIVKGNDNIEDESVDMYYAIRVDKDLPAGTYIGELEYDINPAIEYMQDLATLTSEEKSTLLTNMTQDEQYILKDNRDEKSYYISKLADGNIWMTQNLDLDLNSQTTLTPENTNISASWTPANSTIAFTGTTVDGWQNDDYAPSSADPGDVYYYTSNSDADDMQYNSLAECRAAGHTDCSHYHAGNYYNWSAAVASNDTSNMTEQFSNAPGSICPAGWRLPTGPNVDDINYRDVANLVLSYEDILEETIYEGCGGHCNYYNYLDDGFGKIRISPLWLVRSGGVDNSLSLAGYQGSYYTNTVEGSQHVFVFTFEFNSVRPSSTVRRNGYSIRCLVK